MASASKKTGDEEVGRRIAERRSGLRMSRDDLARQIGASYALVAQIETGWRMPSYEKQLLIARALGAGLDDLFGHGDPGGVAEALDATESLGTAGFGAGAAARPSAPPATSADAFAQAASAFPVGTVPVSRMSASIAPRGAAPRSAPAAPPPPSAPSMPLSASSSQRPLFDEVVDRAADALRELPASRRLDALSRLQLAVTREVVDEERRRVGSDRDQSGWITDLAPDEVFVFGSNAEGRHGAGAARTAYEKFGAEWGRGSGHHGQSYAIVTTSGLAVLHDEVAAFVRYARAHPRLRFLVTPIGTGVAGYRADEIAPLFADSPGNVVLPTEFETP